MRQLQTHARFGLLMSALALMSTPSAVLAQDTCATDDDCEHGYTCEEAGACPAVDCAEGSDCEAIECDPVTACVPVRDCEADADCPASWLCASAEQTDCGDIAEPTCAPGEECVKPDPADLPECNTVTVHYCAPPWQLPCEEAADCGAGFECVERIAMMCSGSSGGGSAGAPTPSGDPQPEDAGAGFAPPAEGDPLPPDDPDSCTSEPTGEYYCQLIETTCQTDADCAAGLTCQEAPSDAVCVGGGSDPGAGGDTPSDDGGSAGAGGAGDADFAPERPACETPEPTFACAPPSYFDGGWGYDLDGRGEATGGSVDPIDDEGGGNNGPSGGTPPASPTDGDDGQLESEEGAAGSGAMSGSSGGCSATGSSRASGSALVMALAVLGLALRRRSLRA